jgi:zinc transport system permease protein
LEAFLTYGFLQRAMVAGVFVGQACAVLGVFLLLRRDAMIGHGLAHITFAGVALAFLLRALPLPVAIVFSAAAALGILKLKESAGVHGDTAIAIVSSVGMALGIILATLAGNFSVSLLNYLFGEVLAIEPAEVWLSLVMAAAALAAVFGNYRSLLFSTFDREAARVAGVPVRRLDALITILTAVTIVLGMKIVGILLVSALIVIPAAAGLQLASSFRAAVALASAAAFVSVMGGLVAAYALDLPASGTIVLAAFVLFSGCFLVRKLRSRTPRSRRAS